MSARYRSIGQVLDLLKGEFSDISISKIRFLESQGLIDPERNQSGYRKFTEADINRLRWVLEQQRDHFLPLKVIKERIDSEAFDEINAERAFEDG
ncbi:MAG: MerR family transcriptional regulator, partial [bacterium]|nr:MerR family transcriptional regulator [bacterium]